MSPGAIGKLMTFRARMSVLIERQPLRLRVRKRPQQHRVHHAEDRRARADAERNREDGGEGERRMVAQGSDGEGEVFGEHEGGVRRRSAVTWDGCGDGVRRSERAGAGRRAGSRRLLRPR